MASGMCRVLRVHLHTAAWALQGSPLLLDKNEVEGMQVPKMPAHHPPACQLSLAKGEWAFEIPTSRLDLGQHTRPPLK